MGDVTLQTLRNLSRSSYINGSHFSILLVNAKGDVEIHASEVLQSRLDLWYNDAVKLDARNVVLRAAQNRAAQAALQEEQTFPDDDPDGVSFFLDREDGEFDGDEPNGTPSSPSSASSFNGGPIRNLSAEFLKADQVSGNRQPHVLSPINPELANSILQLHPKHAPQYTFSADSDKSSGSSSHSMPSSASVGGGYPEVFDVSSLDAWYREKFHDVCNISS